MSGNTNTALRKRALKSVVAEAKEMVKGEDGVSKRSTSLKTAKLADGATEAGVDTGVTRPTDDQLAIINSYTRSPKTADEVACFTTLSCNDLEDRDEDKFTTDTVKAFAELAAPYGPNGKSYMVGHDYNKLPVGRIFDTSTAKVDGALFMTNGVYIPNTPQYQTFLENQDYGIYWAVSVGVMLDANDCSICEAPISRWMNGCYEGHYKGSYYTMDDERDKYDWPIEADPSDPGAVKCIGLMKGARDFYELSQVFLGAQFYAELADNSKTPALAGAIKAAGKMGKKHIPIIGLSAKEAAELPSLAADPKVAEALKKYEVEHDADGDMRWTDDDGFRWVFSAGEVLCIGKEPENNEQEKEDGDGQGSGDQLEGRSAADDESALGEADEEQPESVGGDSSEQLRVAESGSDEPGPVERRPLGDVAEKVAAVHTRLSAVRAAVTSGPEEQWDAAKLALTDVLKDVLDDPASDEEAITTADETITELAAELDVELEDQADDENADDDKKAVSEDMSKKAVLTAAVKASVPASILTKVSQAPDNGLSVLLGALTTHNRELEAEKALLAPKAAMGDAYVKQVRETALDWYIKANASTDGAKGVNVETFTKVLDACGDNVELLQELVSEQQKAAKARFGVPTIRSTVDSDPHTREEIEGITHTPSEEKNGSDARVRKLHG